MKLLPLKQTRSHVATVRRHLMVQGLTQLGWGGEGSGRAQGLILRWIQNQSASKYQPPQSSSQFVPFAHLESPPASVALPLFPFSFLDHLSNQPPLGSCGHSLHKEGHQTTNHSREKGSPPGHRPPCSPGTYWPTGNLTGTSSLGGNPGHRENSRACSLPASH